MGYHHIDIDKDSNASALETDGPDMRIINPSDTTSTGEGRRLTDHVKRVAESTVDFTHKCTPNNSGFGFESWPVRRSEARESLENRVGGGLPVCTVVVGDLRDDLHKIREWRRVVGTHPGVLL